MKNNNIKLVAFLLGTLFIIPAQGALSPAQIEIVINEATALEREVSGLRNALKSLPNDMKKLKGKIATANKESDGSKKNEAFGEILVKTQTILNNITKLAIGEQVGQEIRLGLALRLVGLFEKVKHSIETDEKAEDIKAVDNIKLTLARAVSKLNETFASFRLLSLALGYRPGGEAKPSVTIQIPVEAKISEPDDLDI